MKVFYKIMFTLIVIGVISLSASMLELPTTKIKDAQYITQWQYIVMDKYDPELSTEQLDSMDGWINVNINSPIMRKPGGVSVTQWIKVDLPQLKEESSAILLEKLFATQIVVKIEGNDLYRNDNGPANSFHTVIVPLGMGDSNQVIYIGIENEGNTLGIGEPIKIGNYQDLTKGFIRVNNATYILGSTLIFIALTMLICALFIDTGSLSMWISLCAVILCSGFLVITYSPLSLI